MHVVEVNLLRENPLVVTYKIQLCLAYNANKPQPSPFSRRYIPGFVSQLVAFGSRMQLGPGCFLIDELFDVVYAFEPAVRLQRCWKHEPLFVGVPARQFLGSVVHQL